MPSSPRDRPRPHREPEVPNLRADKEIDMTTPPPARYSQRRASPLCSAAPPRPVDPPPDRGDEHETRAART